MSANSHGNTVAAWTGAGVSFVGFLAAAVGMVAPSPLIVIIGLVLAASGALVGKLMSAAGYGKQPVTSALPAAKETATTSISG
jgi:hypothetical protein